MIAEVIVDVVNSEVDKVFDYKISTPVKVGSRVLVPFGKRKIEGYVLSIKDKSNLSETQLKTILSVEDESLILPEMIQLIDYMTTTFNLRKIDAIRLMLPSGLRNNQIKQKNIKYAKIQIQDYNINLFKKNATKQIECYKYIQHHKVALLSLLNKKFGSQAVEKLKALGLISIYEKLQNRLNQQSENFEKKNIVLTTIQQKIVDEISQSKNQTFLLNGVTGSGKTEVYINTIKNVVSNGKTAIMLVPEISLTPQVLKHFKANFGSDVALLHSGLSLGARFDEWFRIFNGEAKIVVGARSAIFAPMQNLGVIVIDEEHDTSYFSESNPRYNTHEIAMFRSNYNNCPLVLGSATPTVESFFKAKNGEYKLLEMPERINKAPLPQFDIVDMLSEIRSGNSNIFSRKLVAELSDCIKQKKQAIIYLNRRGYQSGVVCRECGYVAKCNACDVPIVYHKQDNMLKCHYCDARYHVLSNCPKCGSGDLRYGAIGTQKVVEELGKIFPNLPVFRMDNDSTKSKDAHQSILSEFAKTEGSVLVGTQMIAKGHDFPLVTLVGIVDADMSLHHADFRASERTFGLITQVAGRAGRGEYEGKVILQTYMPKNYTYRCAVNYDYQNFFKHELNIRKITKFPPFSVIMRVLFAGEDEDKVVRLTKEYYNQILQIKNEFADDFIYINAMKCPVKKIQNKTRYQILMRIAKNNYTKIRNLIYNIDKNVKDKNVTSFVEINPQNLS